MASTVRTFLMFQGKAEEALIFYSSLFEGYCTTRVERYGPGEENREGTLKRAWFCIGHQEFLIFDSPIDHAFTFTPAMSILVDCEQEKDVRRLATALAEGGAVLMPLDRYAFSECFAWVTDKFGVSWQINLLPLPAPPED
ncbi:MAG: 3-demethylubiquinone-9 3-methyltransferase [Puniceicoccaceae bacterium 5H]|nr:MAG: 3-demethylubiquinone-9 3-methyltransferase [Puniceicoccaceae bacterium 5H]